MRRARQQLLLAVQGETTTGRKEGLILDPTGYGRGSRYGLTEDLAYWHRIQSTPETRPGNSRSFQTLELRLAKETVQVLRLTAMCTVMVLYKPKDQQGCQRRYMTNEMLATMAMKCQRMRRIRMRSKDNLSCARIASRYFSKHLLRDGSGTKWTV